MNQISPSTDLRNSPNEDSLDQVFSAYFKSKLRQPWPSAPITSGWLGSEPSLLASTRSTAANVNVQRPVAAEASHGSDNRSRYTLAVSVAVLLGTCCWLSNGFQPGERTGPATSTPPVFNVLPEAGAENPEALKGFRKDKAIHGKDGAIAPKIQKIQLQ